MPETPRENDHNEEGIVQPEVEPVLSSPEIEEITEDQLSPEEIEMIMEKVQDINKEGVAYSVLFRKEKIKDILRDGLLGQEYETGPDSVSGKSWAKKIHESKSGFVHFNIVGRAGDLIDGRATGIYKDVYTPSGEREIPSLGDVSEIGQSQWMRMNYGGLAIIFDVSNYKELPPTYFPEKGRAKSFLAHEPSLESSDSPKPRSEYGFVLSHRVAPRLFKGIFYNSLAGRFEHDESQKTDVQEVRELVNLMHKINERKLENVLPIYNQYGDLMWPKQMSYEEVKQYAEEQDREKDEK